MKEKYVKLSDVIAMLSSDIKNTNDAKSKIEGSVLLMTALNHLKTYEFEDGKK